VDGTPEPNPPFECGQDIRDRTFRFACDVVTFCDTIQSGRTDMRRTISQLLDSSSSTASMMEEAKSGESKREFISKCSIGLKEARESLVRLRILLATGRGDGDLAIALVREANEIVSILTAIIRNTKRNLGGTAGT
jgi:four helix bundle protein